MTTQKLHRRQRIQFAFNADADSMVGCIFQYLIKNHCFSSREGKRKGIDAIVAFYKPFAYQHCFDMNEEELRTMAQDAIEALSSQIKLLCETFDVEYSISISPDFEAKLKQILTDVIKTEAIQRVHPSDTIVGGLSNSFEEFDNQHPVEWDDKLDDLLGDLQTNMEAVA